MKALLMVLLLAGIGIFPCSAGNRMEKKKEARKMQMVLSTDLLDDIRNGRINLEFSLDFHPRWSLTATAGIGTECWRKPKDNVMKEHEENLERKRKTGGEDLTEDQPRARNRHSEKLGLRFHPIEKSGFYLSTALTNENGRIPDLEIGAGWKIRIGGHLVCRIEAAASVLDTTTRTWTEGIALQFGYQF